MERPRLRPLEGYPVTQNGQPMLALRDPSGLTDAVATLPPLAVAVVQLCDGELTRDEICEEFQRRHRQQLPRGALDTLLAQLDDAMLLDSARFRAHSATVFADFGRAEVRAPFLAGRSYPGDPGALARQLDGCFGPPHGPPETADDGGGAPGTGGGAPGTGADVARAARPRAIIAPHVDFARGGPAYAWAYRRLRATRDDVPELVVLFGTDHGGVDQPFTLTRKHYDTPLGRLTTDVELVDRLARTGGADLFRDEHHHRSEHSIEFQAVWLRHVYGARADGLLALPVLCGSLGDHIEHGGEAAAARATAELIEGLRAAVAGRDVLYVAGADLAHVGPRYGDASPLDEADRTSLERRDRVALEPALRGDAAAWFEEIGRERDRRRVCGLAPIYAMLRAAAPGAGRLEVYAQCPAEQGSIVSIAAITYGDTYAGG